MPNYSSKGNSETTYFACGSTAHGPPEFCVTAISYNKQQLVVEYKLKNYRRCNSCKKRVTALGKNLYSNGISKDMSESILTYSSYL